MSIHHSNVRSFSIWLPTLVIVIFICSFIRLNLNIPSLEPPTLLEELTEKKASALDKDPLRIYVPPVQLEHTPLYVIAGLHQEASSPAATYPDVFDEGSSTVSEEQNDEDSPPDELIATEKECPIQPFDISQCPSVERVQENSNVLSAQAPPNDLLSHGFQTDRPLILYAYSESEFGRINLAFFVNHALHDSADFIFILNGETNVDKKILPIGRPNIRVIQRENTCFDLGAHAEVLTKVQDDGTVLKDTYKRFILMNASIRGPFVPHWSRECWSDAYLARLNEKVKLVGSSLNCHNGDSPHVQSMIWATDQIGLSTILAPEGIGECFDSLEAAMGGEIRTTPYLRSKGYEVDVMLSIFQTEKNYKYIDCQNPDDFLYQNSYFGFSVHPFETLFVKSNRGIEDEMLEKLSQWQDMAGYESYDVCRKLGAL